MSVCSLWYSVILQCCKPICNKNQSDLKLCVLTVQPCFVVCDYVYKQDVNQEQIMLLFTNTNTVTGWFFVFVLIKYILQGVHNIHRKKHSVLSYFFMLKYLPLSCTRSKIHSYDICLLRMQTTYSEWIDTAVGKRACHHAGTLNI